MCLAKQAHSRLAGVARRPSKCHCMRHRSDERVRRSPHLLLQYYGYVQSAANRLCRGLDHAERHELGERMADLAQHERRAVVEQVERSDDEERAGSLRESVTALLKV